MSAGTESVHLPGYLREALRDRSEAISFSRSKFLRDIAIWWDKQGRPPVNPPDEAMQRVKELHAAEAPGKYRAK